MGASVKRVLNEPNGFPTYCTCKRTFMCTFPCIIRIRGSDVSPLSDTITFALLPMFFYQGWNVNALIGSSVVSLRLKGDIISFADFQGIHYLV